VYTLNRMKNLPLHRTLLAGSALALLSVATLGQQPSQDRPAAAKKPLAHDVVLQVTVRDHHGALATSVNKDDFTLTEDGRQQTIKSFTRESDLPFLLGLLVDTGRSTAAAMESERKAAGKFIDQLLPTEAKNGPGIKQDQAFLIHFDREVELLQDFTASREKLHRELEEMGPTQKAKSDAQGPETSDDERERPHGRGGTQLYDAIFLASDELMKSKDGRKALIVFSDGVDRGSKDTLNDAIDAAERAGLAVYTIYFKGEQEHNPWSSPGNGGHHGGVGYPGSGGGGYPGGGGGRGGPGGERESLVDGKKIMEKIAERTGGHFFEAKKKDGLDEIYSQIAQELRGQFLLTYTPDMVDKSGGFHKIALKANKGELTVVIREGYFAPEER